MDVIFLKLVDWLGGYSLLVFGVAAICSGLFVLICLPETRGRSLSEIETLLQSETAIDAGQSRGSPIELAQRLYLTC